MKSFHLTVQEAVHDARRREATELRRYAPGEDQLLSRARVGASAGSEAFRLPPT